MGLVSIPAEAVTLCLRAWQGGDENALRALTDLVYADLRRIASAILNSRGGRDPIQPTELVHELYFELPGLRDLDVGARGHFFSLCARLMRQILVDHARRRNAARRGGQAVTLRFDSKVSDPALEIDILLIHDALNRLAESYPRHARVVELRFFGGLTVEETVVALEAEGQNTSYRSVQRDWTFARAWLLDAATNP